MDQTQQSRLDKFAQNFGRRFMGTIFDSSIMYERDYFKRVKIMEPSIVLKNKWTGSKTCNKSAGMMLSDKDRIYRNRGCEFLEQCIENAKRVDDAKIKNWPGVVKQSIRFMDAKLQQSDPGNMDVEFFELRVDEAAIRVTATHESYYAFRALELLNAVPRGISLSNGVFTISTKVFNPGELITVAYPASFLDSRLDVSFLSLAVLMSSESNVSLTKARRRDANRNAARNSLGMGEDNRKRLSFKNVLAELGLQALQPYVDDIDKEKYHLCVPFLSGNGQLMCYGNLLMHSVLGLTFQQNEQGYYQSSAPLQQVLCKEKPITFSLSNNMKDELNRLNLCSLFFLESESYDERSFRIPAHVICNHLCNWIFALEEDKDGR